MTQIAYDVFENADQKYVIVTMKYDPETLFCEIVEQKILDDRGFAQIFLQKKIAMKRLFPQENKEGV